MLQDHAWDAIALAFDKARKRQPSLSELLDFSEKLVKEQHATTAHGPIPALDEGALRDRALRGQPVLPRQEFRIDLAAPAACFGGCADWPRSGGPKRAWRPQRSNRPWAGDSSTSEIFCTAR